MSVCRACPRLVDWREPVAVEKRAFVRRRAVLGTSDRRLGRPASPEVLVVGLAPAAHGGNRTGRVFTGDRSGDWLFASLHRVGLAAQPTSRARRRRAARSSTRAWSPPSGARRPTTSRRPRSATPARRGSTRSSPSCCRDVRAVVCLGLFGWDARCARCAALGYAVPRPRPRFGHGARGGSTGPSGRLVVLGRYHPSQQNTFTGKLTEPMLDAVLGPAAAIGRS